MTTAERQFVRDLETVSADLAAWAQTKIAEHGWCIQQVKDHIISTAKFLGRN